MTTFAEFSSLLGYALQDPTQATYGADLVYQATCAAIDAILPWAPKQETADFTCDGSAQTIVLAADFHRIEAVQDLSTMYFLDRLSLIPGTNRRPLQNGSSLEWIEAQPRTVRFSSVPASGTQIRVYYSGYYSQPSSKTDTTFVFQTPRAARTGMLYFAASYCLVPAAIGAAQIRQFNIKVDSGIPTDNAVETQARFLRTLFLDEMSRLPRVAGAVQ